MNKKEVAEIKRRLKKEKSHLSSSTCAAAMSMLKRIN